MRKSCVTCKHLSSCEEVSAPRLNEGYSCSVWTLAEEEERKARDSIIREFGPSALRFALPQSQVSANARARRRRKHV